MLQKIGDLTERRLAAAEYFQNLSPSLFDMASCHRCIAGHVFGHFVGVSPRSACWDEIKQGARTYLGLTEREASDLFAPGSSVYNEGYTPHPCDAARVLRYLAATGTVDWDVGGRIAVFAAA